MRSWHHRCTMGYSRNRNASFRIGKREPPSDVPRSAGAFVYFGRERYSANPGGDSGGGKQRFKSYNDVYYRCVENIGHRIDARHRCPRTWRIACYRHRRIINMAVDPLLRAANISKSYAGVHALRDASFDLNGGEVHALVGENGAGKSTLIKIITGAVLQDDGEVILNGV